MKYFSNSAFFRNAGRLYLLMISVAGIISCNNNKELKRVEQSVFAETVISARRISIEKHNDFTEVTIINPWQGADNVNMVYNLVRRGSAMPDGMDSSKILFVPVNKIICMSTTHIAMISALGEEKTIAGMSGTGFMYSKVLTDMAGAGLIKDVGYEANLNKELILKIMPDLVMIYGIGSESTGYVGKIQELGIRVLYNADYLETDPLAKAEWIKLFGALYCKEKLADSIYRSEVESYNLLKKHIAESIKVRPKVLLGLPFKDTWFVSPGNSFISKLIGDAGGNYLWKDTDSPVSMPFGLENVYIKALDADFWLNIGSLKSKEEISSVDPRLTELPCFKNGNLYNNNRRITDQGGNDYWESGAVFPHLILKDIASILHPELFGVNELFYYRKLL